MNVLFVVSEVFPLVKTGGLGDVAYSLPNALVEKEANIRLLLPGYRVVLEKIQDFRILGWLDVQAAQGKKLSVRILEARYEAFDFPLWIVDCASLFDRPGNPYVNADGYDWQDNAERFACFSQVASKLAMNALNTGWKADVVHCHDWQTGLVAAYLDEEQEPPKRVFTIHNMAYGGHFSHDEFVRLGLPPHWWHLDKAEFYGGFSMLKAGLAFSDAITTVSPTYADEICTPAFGYGMEGVLNARHYKLSGILNGIDENVWNPEIDPYLSAHYSAKRRNPGKTKNKQALLEHFSADNIDERLEQPLVGMVGRMVEQKGIDLILDMLPQAIEQTDANFIFIGSGQHVFEHRLLTYCEHYPQRVFCHIGYSEQLAHLLEAGADLFLMPSRFEPCGLNQMYSQRYGTLPLVNHTGGLADTVVDTTAETVRNKTATGFVMYEAAPQALFITLNRALATYRDKPLWAQLQRTAMQKSFSWAESAEKYLQLYQY